MLRRQPVVSALGIKKFMTKGSLDEFLHGLIVEGAPHAIY